MAHFQGSWWGEGDDMIWIDDDPEWPPSIHGTGTEDYFNHAWGMQAKSDLYNGAPIHESVVPGYAVQYRFHLTDPVRFNERIKVTIEHGHNNHLSDDWASTAYWYQTLPSPEITVPPLEDRLPTPPSTRTPVAPSRVGNSDEQNAMLDQAIRRHEEYLRLREIEIQKKLDRTRAREAGNKELGQLR